MSIGSNVSEHSAALERPSRWSQISFSFEAIAYVLRTTDALVILLSALFGAFSYHWVSQSPLPNLVEYYALGLIASFLSIRKEYVGQPETVKALFVDNATDLRRDPTFQGSGLVDIMRTIQAV